jgi:hypothetical protein
MDRPRRRARRDPVPAQLPNGRRGLLRRRAASLNRYEVRAIADVQDAISDGLPRYVSGWAGHEGNLRTDVYIPDAEEPLRIRYDPVAGDGEVRVFTVTITVEEVT